MYTIDHLRELFEYEDWAIDRTIEALERSMSDKSLKILAHLLITKQEYLERLHGKDSTGFDFWPDFDLDGCRQMADLTSKSCAQLLGTSDESLLERTTSYKTSEGIPYTNTYREMLTHILFHSSIHRGNIVLKMREEGFEPPKIDYIIYLREQHGPSKSRKATNL